MTVKCPHCGCFHELSEEYIGQFVGCSCGQSFVVGVVSVHLASFKNGSADIVCPYCEALMAAPFAAIDKDVRCGNCNGKFHIICRHDDKDNTQHFVNVEPVAGLIQFTCPRCGDQKSLQITDTDKAINVRCKRCNCWIKARIQNKPTTDSGRESEIFNGNMAIDNKGCRQSSINIGWIALVPTLFLLLCLCIGTKWDMFGSGEGKYKKDVLAYDQWLTYNGFGENNFTYYGKTEGKDHYLLMLNNHRVAFSKAIYLQQHSGRYWGPSSWPPGDVMEIIELRKRIYRYQKEHGLPENNWVTVVRDKN